MVVVGRHRIEPQIYVLAEGTDPERAWANPQALGRVFNSLSSRVFLAGNLHEIFTWIPVWERGELPQAELEQLLEQVEVQGCPLEEPWAPGPCGNPVPRWRNG